MVAFGISLLRHNDAKKTSNYKILEANTEGLL